MTLHSYIGLRSYSLLYPVETCRPLSDRIFRCTVFQDATLLPASGLPFNLSNRACPYQESNLSLLFRRESSCPLDHKGRCRDMSLFRAQRITGVTTKPLRMVRESNPHCGYKPLGAFQEHLTCQCRTIHYLLCTRRGIRTPEPYGIVCKTICFSHLHIRA